MHSPKDRPKSPARRTPALLGGALLLIGTIIWALLAAGKHMDENATLRALADKRHIGVGTAVTYNPLVNEAFNDDGSLRDTIWLRTIGPAYIELAFLWTHEADPDALLFYNDYANEGMNANADAIYRMGKDLKQRGVPIHGVGWQMHISVGPGGYAGVAKMADNLKRLTDLGLQVHITELDVKLQNSSAAMAERLAAQAAVYGDVTSLCLSHRACTALVLWGFTDKYTWIPGFTANQDWPLVFDRDYQPKPAYRALQKALQEGGVKNRG